MHHTFNDDKGHRLFGGVLLCRICHHEVSLDHRQVSRIVLSSE